ncbi:hypothetical protein [Ferrimonas lipolytica]|uniref:Uncharacterized protein n=1 Tax=Ferrimonas lipolytica TaxID=2724191 RepID=A0A6H1UGV7_9GAMM|nr:hypothetical protein [Ferrimonas lipolytica]QIZ77446.1 hypothetical protein HER31_11455 [Ferrimonas lipolytica]
MFTLSIADKYHLQLELELGRSTRKAQWQMHLYAPSILAIDSASNNGTSFYSNLLQTQRLQPMPQQWPDLLQQYQLALSSADKEHYPLALAAVVNHLLQQFKQANGAALLAMMPMLFSVLRLTSATAPTKKRFAMAQHIVLFNYHQALLRERHNANKALSRALNRRSDRIHRYCINHNFGLSGNDDNSRETLLAKLQLSERIVNRPFTLERQMLSSGRFAQQLIFGIAAASAMAFATGIAFATQRAFGNFTTPFFFSLVVSYIFKDRLKELGREYLLEKYLRHFNQHKYRLSNGATKQEWVQVSESYFRLSGKRLREELANLVKKVRSGHSSRVVSVWCFRRCYQMAWPHHDNPLKFEDKLTINLSKQLRLLPSNLKQFWHQDNQQLRKLNVQHVHTIFVTIDLQQDNINISKTYRIHVSRQGIHRIKQINPPK